MAWSGGKPSFAASHPKIELRRFQPFAGRAEPRGLAAGSGYFADAPLNVPIDNLWWRVPITL
jgi:hypothetical protein